MKLATNKTVILLASIGLLGVTSASFADTSLLSGTPATTVELGNLDAISMGTLSLGQAAQAEEQLCVYSNSGATGAYKVTFTATEGSFKLANGSDKIPYTVTYNDQDGSSEALVT